MPDIPRLATDNARRIVWRWEADAFGLVQAMEDPEGDGVGESVRLRFPGQIVDDESGLFYNYFRDYEPGSGRHVIRLDWVGGLIRLGMWGESTFKY